MRLYHHGDPLYRTARIRGTSLERLKHMTELDTNTGCIVWTGAVDKRGYGRLADDNGWYDMAHRLSYKLNVGVIPKGKVIHHKCFNTRCVNYKHLEVATHYENIIEKGRSNAAYINYKKTHCIHGHSLSDAYVTRSRYGKMRMCRPCTKIRQIKYLEKLND